MEVGVKVIFNFRVVKNGAMFGYKNRGMVFAF
jgi:hypothetical protein